MIIIKYLSIYLVVTAVTTQTLRQRQEERSYSLSTLPWCSQELGRMLHSLDRKPKRRRTAKGTSMTVQRRDQEIQSTRPAPEDAPAICTVIGLPLLALF